VGGGRWAVGGGRWAEKNAVILSEAKDLLSPSG